MKRFKETKLMTYFVMQFSVEKGFSFVEEATRLVFQKDDQEELLGFCKSTVLANPIVFQMYILLI